MQEVILERFEEPDEMRTIEKDRFEVVWLGGMTIGRATAAMDDGRVIEMKAGDVFYVAPGHDRWVAGEEPYVSLHFLSADAYAKGKGDKKEMPVWSPALHKSIASIN